MELRYLSSAFLSTKADAAVFCVARDFADDPLFQAVDGAVATPAAAVDDACLGGPGGPVCA